MQKTACWSIQSATTRFTANVFPYRHRVSLKEAFEGPEPDDGKLSRPVLRGPAPSNGDRLLGEWFVELTRQGVYWVTRLKENADYLVVERRPIPAGGKVLVDEIISFYRLPGQRAGVLLPADRNLGRRTAAPLSVPEQSSAVRPDHLGRDL